MSPRRPRPWMDPPLRTAPRLRPWLCRGWLCDSRPAAPAERLQGVVRTRKQGNKALQTVLLLLLSRFNRVRLRERTDCRPPGSLSMGFSGQEHCSGLPCPPPGGLPYPGIEPRSPESPALAGKFFTTSAIWQIKRRWLLLLCCGLH